MLNTPFRSAISFFLLTFSTAFLMTVGMRMTGWFTRAPQITIQENMVLGLCIMLAVTALALGAFLHRLELIELRSALLGAASVLMALPRSEAAINQTWSLGTTIVTALGFICLGLGFVVSVGLNNHVATIAAATKP